MEWANGATIASTNPAAWGERQMVWSAMNPSFHAGSSPAANRAQQLVSR